MPMYETRSRWVPFVGRLGAGAGSDGSPSVTFSAWTTMEVERERSLQAATWQPSFDPLAVPTAYTFPASTSSQRDGALNDDLQRLAEERLFSGTRQNGDTSRTATSRDTLQSTNTANSSSALLSEVRAL